MFFCRFLLLFFFLVACLIMILIDYKCLIWRFRFVQCLMSGDIECRLFEKYANQQSFDLILKEYREACHTTAWRFSVVILLLLRNIRKITLYMCSLGIDKSFAFCSADTFRTLFIYASLFLINEILIFDIYRTDSVSFELSISKDTQISVYYVIQLKRRVNWPIIYMLKSILTHAILHPVNRNKPKW